MCVSVDREFWRMYSENWLNERRIQKYSCVFIRTHMLTNYHNRFELAFERMSAHSVLFVFVLLSHSLNSQ